jgi:hypothetical protein
MREQATRIDHCRNHIVPYSNEGPRGAMFELTPLEHLEERHGRESCKVDDAVRLDGDLGVVPVAQRAAFRRVRRPDPGFDC